MFHVAPPEGVHVASSTHQYQSTSNIDTELPTLVIGQLNRQVRVLGGGGVTV